jgi:hypothetical protein
MVRSDRGPFKPAGSRRVRAMHDFFFENLRNPVRMWRVVVMRQFSTNQVDSTKFSTGIPNLVCFHMFVP